VHPQRRRGGGHRGELAAAGGAVQQRGHPQGEVRRGGVDHRHQQLCQLAPRGQQRAGVLQAERSRGGGGGGVHTEQPEAGGGQRRGAEVAEVARQPDGQPAAAAAGQPDHRARHVHPPRPATLRQHLRHPEVEQRRGSRRRRRCGPGSRLQQVAQHLCALVKPGLAHRQHVSLAHQPQAAHKVALDGGHRVRLGRRGRVPRGARHRAQRRLPLLALPAALVCRQQGGRGDAHHAEVHLLGDCHPHRVGRRLAEVCPLRRWLLLLLLLLLGAGAVLRSNVRPVVLADGHRLAAGRGRRRAGGGLGRGGRSRVQQGPQVQRQAEVVGQAGRK
jgi:hypothetical protein